MRVLGIDPGSAVTGWALVEGSGSRYRLEEAGMIRTRSGQRAERLAELERRLGEVVDRLRPDCAAVEAAFTGRNPRTSLVLAESRGVVLAVLGMRGVEVSSYPPATIKQTIVGQGRAEKRQVAYMVVRLLGLAEAPQQDAADAMATALTHLHSSRWAKIVDCPNPPC